jgi:activator of HSP90 ATPase
MTIIKNEPTVAVERKLDRPAAIHQEVTFFTSPEHLYELLTDSEKFAAATDRPATIGIGEGDTFSIFGGYVEGRQIELVPGQRIVQAWRGKDWDAGTYSMVKFTLTPEGRGTKLEIDHDAYPDGASPLYPSWHQHLSSNWPVFYFAPFSRYLAN